MAALTIGVPSRPAAAGGRYTYYGCTYYGCTHHGCTYYGYTEPPGSSRWPKRPGTPGGVGLGGVVGYGHSGCTGLHPYAMGGAVLCKSCAASGVGLVRPVRPVRLFASVCSPLALLALALLAAQAALDLLHWPHRPQ